MNVSSQRANGAVPSRSVATRPTAQAAPATRSQPAGARDASSVVRGGPDRTAQLARFDGFADALRARVALAEQSMEGVDASRLKEAREWLEHGLERLRSGFADGSLDPVDMERGVGNLFAGAARIMAESGEPTDSKVPDVTVEDADPIERGDLQVAPAEDLGSAESFESGESNEMAAAMRERMQSLVDHVLGRAEAAGYPDEQRDAAAAEATALFAQAAERLENAVFSPGEGAPLDRAQLARFFQTSFSALQGQILALLGDGSSAAGSPATTYGPGAGAEAMSTPRGRVDFAG
ncbi:MAG: hypothetical protein VX015_14625 [Planctomycetota bacterium]|nr:hypothetical protein [Planctomycetota bacterium]